MHASQINNLTTLQTQNTSQLNNTKNKTQNLQPKNCTQTLESKKTKTQLCENAFVLCKNNVCKLSLVDK